jgi:hypothetical protein
MVSIKKINRICDFCFYAKVIISLELIYTHKNSSKNYGKILTMTMYLP